MDEQLKAIAINTGLGNLVDTHPELVEAAWKRARIYAGKLEPLEMTDEPAHVYRPTNDVKSE